MRYVGQSYELRVEAPDRELGPGDEKLLNNIYFKVHERAYGYAATTEPTEMVNLRLTAIGASEAARNCERSSGVRTERLEPSRASGASIFRSSPNVEYKIYDRYGLRWGSRIEGPAIVKGLIPRLSSIRATGAEVDRYGNILITEQ